MRRVTRLFVVVALLWGLAATASAGRARFIPTKGRPGLKKVQKRGKLAVSRTGNKIRVRAYIPATRNGVEGVEVRELERKAAPQSAPAEVEAAGKSFEQAVEIAVDETWRDDVAAKDLYRGALSRLRSKRVLDEVTAFERATDGVARSLRADSGPKRDKWTRYLDPADYAQWQADLSGSSIGLGVQTRAKKGTRGLTITRVTPKSAAARAGLRKGDRPLAIDGVKLTPRNWIDILKTKGDQPFKLTYERKGVQRTIAVKREPMRWPVLAQRTRTGMAVIRFNDGFTDGIAGEIRDALVGLEKRGPLRGIVIDLRGNGGGLVREAQALLDDLVASGNLGVYLYGDGRREDFEASGQAPFGDVPLAVLIDGNSASMGEHVPNVLKSIADERGVVILGEKTYGKGLMQSTYELPRGAFKISNATFNNGKLETTQGNPVVPDIDKAEAIRRQKEANPGKRVVDPVLKQALAELDRMATARTPANVIPLRPRAERAAAAPAPVVDQLLKAAPRPGR